MEALSHSHYASETCHALELSRSFIVRRLWKNLNMMIFFNFKTTFCKKCIWDNWKIVIFGLWTCVSSETVFNQSVQFFCWPLLSTFLKKNNRRKKQNTFQNQVPLWCQSFWKCWEFGNVSVSKPIYPEGLFKVKSMRPTMRRKGFCLWDPLFLSLYTRPGKFLSAKAIFLDI